MGKFVVGAYADSEVPDQPARPRSLIRTEFLDSVEYVDAQQGSLPDCASSLTGLYVYCSHMTRLTFFRGAAQIHLLT